MIQKSSLLLAALLVADSPATLDPDVVPDCEIEVTADVLVSKGPSVHNDKEDRWSGYFRETRIDVNPNDPKNILVSGSYEPGELAMPGKSDDQRGRVSVLYRSADGGKSWEEIQFRPLDKTTEGWGGDPVVFFDRDGNAYYEDTYQKQNRLYRSKDGGKTWSEIASFEFVDQVLWTGNPKTDKYRTMIYGVGMNTDPIPDNPKRHEYHIVLIILGEDGKPVLRDVTSGTEIAGLLNTTDYLGMNAAHFPMVSRSGKLFMPMENWSNDTPMDGQRHKLELHKRWLMVSDDHGRTNSKPRRLAKADGSDLLSGLGTYRPGFAIDVTDGPFSNRLYTAFMDTATADGAWALYLAHSDDEGQTWSEPVKIEDQEKLAESYYFDSAFPAITVNNQGVVMVSWSHFTPGPETTDTAGKKHLHTLARRVMTASLDGGKTFLPIEPLSSTTAEHENNDYIGIASDKNGRAHSLWTDARSGPAHMYYASARVVCDGKPAKASRPGK